MPSYPRKEIWGLYSEDGTPLLSGGALSVTEDAGDWVNVYKFLLNAASRDMAVNGSVTPVVFEWENTTGVTVYVHRMLIYYADAGTFDANLYANGAILTNGIEFKHVNAADEVILDLMDGFPVKTNSHWSALCYDWQYNAVGTGDNTASVRWTFDKAGKSIQVADGEKLQMTINDNLTGLTEHFAQIQGWYSA